MFFDDARSSGARAVRLGNARHSTDGRTDDARDSEWTGNDDDDDDASMTEQHTQQQQHQPTVDDVTATEQDDDMNVVTNPTTTNDADADAAPGGNDANGDDDDDGARTLVDAMENAAAKNDTGDAMVTDDAPVAKRARGGDVVVGANGEDPSSRGGRGAGTSDKDGGEDDDDDDAMDEDGVNDDDDDNDDDGDLPTEQRGLEDYDDQLTLPRRTKVLISGNNRTKGKLVGLKGIVKKAVGLGGWHWLVLSNGQEVRLQRNALTVLEHPSGDEPESDGGDEEDVENGEEEDDEEGGEGEDGEGDDGEGEGDDDEDDDDDDEDGDEKDAMKTRLRRPTRVPGNGPPSQAAAAAMKRLQERRRSARPNCQSNFERLTTTTLLKYKKAYGLEANEKTDQNKRALIQEVGKHFISQKVDEQKVLQQFMCSVADTTQLN